MTRKEKLYNRITEHGETLKRYFPNIPEGKDPVRLCKSLFRLENQAHQYTTQCCNGDITAEQMDAYEEMILKRVNNQLRNFNMKMSPQIPLFVNRDCRGYAIKMTAEASKDFEGPKDMFGYFIIAPDFREETD